MNITIIGVGAYSVGLAMQLSKKENYHITMWSENKNIVKEANEKRSIKEIFPDIKLSNNIKLTNNYEDALNNSNLIILATSSKYINSVLDEIKPFYENTSICIASKGIEHTSLKLLSEIVKEKLHTNKICVISGPTFAIDLIHNEPSALAIAGYNKKTTLFIKKVIENETLKLRMSSDIYGIQLCGSIKNIIAIASGILKGLGYSESTQAFLINESLHDMKNIIYYLGGKKKTILSFAGVGDLLLTCTSTKSRNYTFGFIIGSTKDARQIIDYLQNNTVEGYYTLTSITKMLKLKNKEIPLITLISDIVSNKKSPEELPKFLISKD